MLVRLKRRAVRIADPGAKERPFGRVLRDNHRMSHVDKVSQRSVLAPDPELGLQAHGDHLRDAGR
jgi:hypothetical protein